MAVEKSPLITVKGLRIWSDRRDWCLLTINREPVVLFSEMLVTTIRYCSVRAGSHPSFSPTLFFPRPWASAVFLSPAPLSPVQGREWRPESDLDQSCQLSVYRLILKNPLEK